MRKMRQPKGITDPGLLSALDQSRKILIIGHISPDGDCVGSMLAVGMALEKKGKSVSFCLQDPVPGRYRFLKDAERILPPESFADAVFDLALAVDCADEGRMGSAAPLFRACPATAQIDHHATNPLYASFNEVDGCASCAGCIVWRMMGEWGIKPDIPMAECLYCAISTDTGRFCFSSTDEETFLCAADIVSSGFDISRCARNVHLVREVPFLKLLGAALSGMRFFAGGRCAAMWLDRADFTAAGASGEHADGIINYALNIPGVGMAYMVNLCNPGEAKFSFRAVPPYHVNDIAALFGGGGHVLAGGFRTTEDPRRVADKVEAAMEAEMDAIGSGAE